MLYNVGKYILHLPEGHVLPTYQATNPLYDRGYIPALRKIIADGRGAVVDVGANVGDTASLLCTLGAKKIICVEGEERFLDYLRRNLKQLEADVKLFDRFLYSARIEKLNLKYMSGSATGGFVPSNEKQMVDKSTFVTMGLIESAANNDINLFKTDTDGLDLFIVEDFLQTTSANNAVIFMEFNPNFSITSMEYCRAFLTRFRRESYTLAIFCNRGAPLTFLEDINEDVVTDFLRYIQFTLSNSVTPFHYLDLFLFPKRRRNLFHDISAGYRSRVSM